MRCFGKLSVFRIRFEEQWTWVLFFSSRVQSQVDVRLQSSPRPKRGSFGGRSERSCPREGPVPHGPLPRATQRSEGRRKTRARPSRGLGRTGGFGRVSPYISLNLGIPSLSCTDCSCFGKIESRCRSDICTIEVGVYGSKLTVPMLRCGRKASERLAKVLQGCTDRRKTGNSSRQGCRSLSHA